MKNNPIYASFSPEITIYTHWLNFKEGLFQTPVGWILRFFSNIIKSIIATLRIAFG